jgi:2-dehydro-3-deoxyphosphogluconate aldolase/(4S)-4-hydroxy-2-oxoglutarate aldolase
LGLRNVKFFPAEAYGGVKTLKALYAVNPDIGFVPTGGVDEKNLSSYLELPHVLAVGGTWLVASDLLARGAYDEIEARSARAVAMAQAMAR